MSPLQNGGSSFDSEVGGIIKTCVTPSIAVGFHSVGTVAGRSGLWLMYGERVVKEAEAPPRFSELRLLHVVSELLERRDAPD